MYECEIWTIKKAEHWRNDAFELWCWQKLLRVPWTTGSSNQPVLKEINPEYSLEGLMLKLNLQHFDHLIWRANSLEKTMMLGKIKGRRRKGNRGWNGWHHWLKGLEFEQATEHNERQGSLACCSLWGRKDSNTTEQLNNNNNIQKLTPHWLQIISLILTALSFS